MHLVVRSGTINMVGHKSTLLFVPRLKFFEENSQPVASKLLLMQCKLPPKKHTCSIKVENWNESSRFSKKEVELSFWLSRKHFLRTVVDTIWPCGHKIQRAKSLTSFCATWHLSLIFTELLLVKLLLEFSYLLLAKCCRSFLRDKKTPKSTWPKYR